MRTLIGIITGLLVGYTVGMAAFGHIPLNMPHVLVGYLLSVGGVTAVALMGET